MTHLINTANTSRPKNISTVKTVKELAKGFQQIYDILELQVVIETVDTDDDALIARELSRPTHLAGAARAAMERAKLSKQKVN